MGNGFDEAKQRRSWLERLGEKIPGFRGFQDRELRREVDRLQREHLSRQVEELKRAVRGKARVWTDAGQLGVLDLFDRLDRRLEGLSQSIRFSDYGTSGFFDVVKFGEDELEKLYEFDLSLLDDLSSLSGDVQALPLPADGEPRAALEQALSRLETLEIKWKGRENVVAEVVRVDR
jgi:hypothetical protein